MAAWVLETYPSFGREVKELEMVLALALRVGRINFINWLMTLPTFEVRRRDASGLNAIDHALRARQPDAIQIMLGNPSGVSLGGLWTLTPHLRHRAFGHRGSNAPHLLEQV